MSEKLSEITAGDIMNRNVITVSDMATIPEMLDILRKQRIKGAPVLDESGKLCGVVSTTDVTRFISATKEERENFLNENVDFHTFSVEHTVEPNMEIDSMEGFYLNGDRKILVKEIMTPQTITVGPEVHVREVARMMYENMIHKIVVTDDQRNIVGIISTLDILHVVASSVYG